jgi:hypothetical protein
VKHFESAIANEAIRRNPDMYALYNGACLAALASAKDGAGASAHRKLALDWLRLDLEQRKRQLTSAEQAGVPEEELAGRRTQLVEYADRAQKVEADFASLRGTPAFEKIFRDVMGK